MQRVKIVAVGRLKEKWLSEGVAEYAKRLGRFCRLEIAEVDEERVDATGTGASVARAMRREGERVLSRLPEDAYVVVADVGGDSPSSEAFASRINAPLSIGRELVFVVGGSHGAHAELLARADWKLSMSRMTFPHQLARLMLVEQIYRAFKILANETYHK